jgi:thioester reductase-like protein
MTGAPRTVEKPRRVLLTGATGLLGRYLLRDLLARGHRVAVLVRDSRTQSAAVRVAALRSSCENTLGFELPPVTVISGDLTRPRLGLSPTDQIWLTGWCDTIVHAAASLAFSPNSAGEPWATNVAGVERLLDFCRRMDRPTFHYVSTAYVCGKANGPALEDGPRNEPSFHNAYERSKYAAEMLVRNATGISATVYRPAIIVGDSRTGFTCSYDGVYRFWEVAARMAESGNPRRRLPWTGDETRNFVPVDWVSQTIVQLVSPPERHGATFHLVAKTPISVRLLKEVTEVVLNTELGQFAGPDVVHSLDCDEATDLDYLRDYLPYLSADPVFDRRNLDAALPDLAEPRLDHDALARMIRFALRERFGRRNRTVKPRLELPPVNCADFLERFFPEAEKQAGLARLAQLNASISVEIHGPGGGHWSCRWASGHLVAVERGSDADARVRFRIDTSAFSDLVLGRLDAQEEFVWKSFVFVLFL